MALSTLFEKYFQDGKGGSTINTIVIYLSYLGIMSQDYQREGGDERDP